MRERRPLDCPKRQSSPLCNQHDGNRVCAREVLSIARRTLAHVPAAPHLGRVTADRAESVTVVPVELRPRLRHDAGLVSAEETGRRPGIREPDRIVRPQSRRRAARRWHVHRKVRDAVLQTQKRRLAFHAEPLHVPSPQPVQRRLMAVVDGHVELGHHQKSGIRVSLRCRSARRRRAAGGRLCPVGCPRIRVGCRAYGILTRIKTSSYLAGMRCYRSRLSRPPRRPATGSPSPSPRLSRCPGPGLAAAEGSLPSAWGSCRSRHLGTRDELLPPGS